MGSRNLVAIRLLNPYDLRMIRATFWGVRGSIPVPGPATAKIGGNTSCVEIRCGETLLVFDGGTGLRVLGQQLVAAGPQDVHMFFSHVHWDHIQGFPFFAPAFVKGFGIKMYGGKNVCGTVESALAGQMESPNFPVILRDLPSKLSFHDLGDHDLVELADGIRVHTAPGHHPGGVLAYRIEYQGKSVVYATDTEHKAGEVDEKLVALAKDADILIFDAQYTPEEYAGVNGGMSKVGWGHSTFDAAIEVAKAAGAKQCVLYHHDPGQDDAAVAAKEARAKVLFPSTVAAFEGLTLET